MERERTVIVLVYIFMMQGFLAGQDYNIYHVCYFQGSRCDNITISCENGAIIEIQWTRAGYSPEWLSIPGQTQCGFTDGSCYVTDSDVPDTRCDGVESCIIDTCSDDLFNKPVDCSVQVSNFITINYTCVDKVVPATTSPNTTQITEITQVLTPTMTATESTASNSSISSASSNLLLIVVPVVGVTGTVVLVILIIIIVFLCVKRKRKAGGDQRQHDTNLNDIQDSYLTTERIPSVHNDGYDNIDSIPDNSRSQQNESNYEDIDNGTSSSNDSKAANLDHISHSNFAIVNSGDTRDNIHSDWNRERSDPRGYTSENDTGAKITTNVVDNKASSLHTNLESIKENNKSIANYENVGHPDDHLSGSDLDYEDVDNTFGLNPNNNAYEHVSEHGSNPYEQTYTGVHKPPQMYQQLGGNI